MVRVNGYYVPDDYYVWKKGHTWAKIEENGLVRVGITDVGAKAAGKIILIKIKPKGSKVVQGKPLAMAESAKWVGKVESPVSGTIEEVNENVVRNPSLLSTDPYGDGWIALIRPSNLSEDLKKLVKGSDIAGWYKEEIERLLG
ncbi:MAG: glycine cleavage system protein H [Thermoprotei archaeon]|nr:MAG: glycine cleavage system protein H [Thermoprotei archaeon]HDI75247.1 glycine cleavage system protein H [Thermoprotei archaeon]